MSPTSAPDAQPRSANVARLLTEVTAEHPDRAALLADEGRACWTFGEVTDRAAAIASGLVRRGFCPGERVALLVRDPAQALVVAVATLWAGGTLVVPPTSAGWRTSVQLAARTRPTVVVADARTWTGLIAVPGLIGARLRVVTGTRRLPALVTLADLAEHWRAASTPQVPRSADAPAIVSWTTGTTGRPHAVIRTHGVLAAQHSAIAHLRTPRSGDIDLVGLPNMALHDLACGVPIVMPPRGSQDPDGVHLRDLVTRAGVTMAVGFPVLFERLVRGAAPAALPGLRSIHVGGAPVPRRLIDRLADIAPHAAVVIVYGTTEAEPIAAIEVNEHYRAETDATPGRGLLVGRPFEGIDVRLAPIHPGTTAGSSASFPGRILVAGGRVAHDPIRSDADGWLDTGDVGTLDDDGRLWLLGRASSMVPGGVVPAAVEEPLAAIEGVEAAVLVSARGQNGPRLVVAIQPAGSASPTVVRQQVATMASSRGWSLDRVAVVRQLPRDPRSGKIDYRRLRVLIGEG